MSHNPRMIASQGFGLHSGTLTVHNDVPGQGATFILELPLTEEKHTA